MTNSWYTAGSVTVQSGSTTVNGSETQWLEADIKRGDIFLLKNIPCEISIVKSSTEIILARAYTGPNVQSSAYEIIPRARQVLSVEVVELIQKLIDTIQKRESTFSEVAQYASKFKKAGLDIDENHNVYQKEPEQDAINEADIATDDEIQSLIHDVMDN